MGSEMCIRDSVDVALLTGKLKVKLDRFEDGAPVSFNRDEVIPVKNNRAKREN